jgi:hypothetical protein
MMLLTARIGSVGFMQLLGALWRPLVAAVIMGVTVELLPIVSGHVLFLLVVKLVLCALVYAVVSLILWAVAGRPEGVERSALERLTSLLRRS